MTDEKIIEQIRKGDEKMIAFLYKKHYRMMVKMVMQKGGTEEEGKDIYQDALVVFWEKVMSDNLVLTSKISTFLYSICQNLWRKEFDRKSRLSREEVERGESIDFERQEKIKIINQCINALGETCRKILQLYYFDKLSMQELAEQMGYANADTAKTKKYKCKLELDKKVKTLYKASDFLD
jgi:RNA polymerase sigma factor (sigma-70 family)